MDIYAGELLPGAEDMGRPCGCERPQHRAPHPHTLLPRTEYVPSRSSSSSWGAEVSDAAKSAYAWGRFTIGWAAVRASSLLDGKK